ncbi:MAG: sulfatase-like hydrolase/transferase, partial [Chitinophagaceae bacterium]|nr:sulfatase-like hydrolase/transferase [Chitinophagaceae bacterium]
MGAALILLLASCNQTQTASTADNDGSTFKGDVQLDVRDSKADWAPYIRKKAPEGAPNILFILYDDTGLGAWSPYGGRINMPTMDALAADGLTYTQWHTVALCSPTRSCINTGRNHNLNGMGSITEGANGFPGYSCQLPPQAATMAQILNDNGWSTFWIGKDHNVPETDLSAGANKSQWP